MALSGTLKTSSYEGRYYQFDWKATQSASSNQSTISWTLKAVGGSAGWYAERTLKVILAGSTIYSKTDRVQRYSGTITSGTKVIAHDSSGNASFSISVQAAVYGTSVNCTGSGSFTLDNIPRKSTLTVENGTLGTAQTLTVTKASSGFTHTITATCGSASTTVCTTSDSTSISFTPPLEWASQNTEGTTVSVVYKITTYNGSTSIGSNGYTKSYTIPSSVKPSCTVDVIDPTGYAETYGGYIKGLSKFEVVVTPTISYGSTIASYSTTANGSTYSSSSFTTDILKSSGTLTISATVKDKRGRSGTASISNTVLDYAFPSVNLLTVRRCDSDGTANDQGEYCKIVFSAAITSLNSKNTAEYSLKYKKSSSSTYTSVTLDTYDGEYSVSEGNYIFAADGGSSYDIQLSAIDAFGATTRSTSMSTTTTLINWLASGLGMAIGKVAELSEYLEIAFQTLFHKNVVLKNSVVLYSQNANGDNRNMVTMNSKNNAYFGYGGYSASEGTTFFCGNNVRISYKDTFRINDKTFLDTVYPVNSIYISYSHTSPASLFGGTWTRISDSFLYGCASNATIGETGGSSTHTLTASEMPAHAHKMVVYNSSGTDTWTPDYGSYLVTASNITSSKNTYGAQLAMNYAGTGAAHNNMPPYTNVSIWRRTA